MLSEQIHINNNNQKSEITLGVFVSISREKYQSSLKYTQFSNHPLGVSHAVSLNSHELTFAVSRERDVECNLHICGKLQCSVTTAVDYIRWLIHNNLCTLKHTS